MASPTTRRKAAYEAELNAIAKRFSRLEDETIRGMIAMLQDLRKGIAAEVATTEFKAFQLAELQNNIGGLIDQFNSQLTKQTGQALTGSAQMGAASVVEPLRAAGIDGLFFAANQAQVNVALDFSAQLIQNITEPMRGSINTQLRLSTLGQRSPFETMKAVTDILGVKARDGIWGTRRRPEVVKGVAARGEAIVRTEMTRMYNLATHAQQMTTAETMPEIKKRWLATGDNRTRVTHLSAHGQEVPIDKPFIVGAVEMMYPGDPAAPAGETVNCRCTTITIHPDIETPELPIDQQIRDERAQREKDRLRRRQRTELEPDTADREAFTPEYWETRQALRTIDRDGEFYEGERQDTLDLLTTEQEASQIARRHGFMPGRMTNQQWSTLADDLIQESGEKLELATLADREAAGNRAVGRRRVNPGEAGTIQVGGKTVDRTWVGGSRSAAERATSKINADTALQAIDFMDKKLIEYGYSPETIERLPISHRGRGGGGLGQRRKLLAEIGNGELIEGRVGTVSVEERQRIIAAASGRDKLRARAMAMNPRAADGIEVWNEYETAMIKAGRADEIVPLPNINEEDIPDYLLRNAAIPRNREPITFEFEDVETIDF